MIRRWSGRLILAALLAGFLLGYTTRALAAPRPEPKAIPTATAVIPVTVPHGESDPTARTEAPRIASPAALSSTDGPPVPSPTAAALPTASPRASTLGAASVSGIASWGTGWTGVVTRLPRGTAITVCGRLGCWSGRSVGYGPAKWTGRIADLSAIVFRDICGPLSIGLCTVMLRY